MFTKVYTLKVKAAAYMPIVVISGRHNREISEQQIVTIYKKLTSEYGPFLESILIEYNTLKEGIQVDCKLRDDVVYRSDYNRSIRCRYSEIIFAEASKVENGKRVMMPKEVLFFDGKNKFVDRTKACESLRRVVADSTIKESLDLHNRPIKFIVSTKKDDVMMHVEERKYD